MKGWSTFLGSKAWRNGLKYPIYVPKELAGIRLLLSEGRVSDACVELWRLNQLGSDQAAAVLAFMYLRGVSWTEVSDAEVTDACRRVALRGNSFAQFVMALRERNRKDYRKEWSWLKMANKHNFGASLGESARLAGSIIGKPGLALPYFKRALHARHIPSMLYFVGYCVRGYYGWMARIFGLIALPVALLTVAITLRYFPFSEKGFIHLLSDEGRLFDRD